VKTIISKYGIIAKHIDKYKRCWCDRLW